MRQLKSLRRQGGWVQLAIAGAGAAHSVLSGSSAKDDIEEAGEAAAFFTMADYRETQRRKDITDAAKIGLTTAAIGASNIQATGSSAVYRQDMLDEIERENAWLKKSAELQAYAQKKGANVQGQATFNSALATGIQYTGQAIAAGFEWYEGNKTANSTPKKEVPREAT